MISALLSNEKRRRRRILKEMETRTLCCIQTAASVSALSEVINVWEAAQSGTDGRDEHWCLVR